MWGRWARGGAGRRLKWRDWAGFERTRGTRDGGEAEGWQVRALPVVSRLEFGDLGEVTQTLGACFLFAKTAPAIEPTSQALLVGVDERIYGTFLLQRLACGS